MSKYDVTALFLPHRGKDKGVNELCVKSLHKTRIEVSKAVHWDTDNSIIYQGSFHGVANFLLHLTETGSLTAHDTKGQVLRNLPISTSPIHQLQHHESTAIVATGRGAYRKIKELTEVRRDCNL